MRLFLAAGVFALAFPPTFAPGAWAAGAAQATEPPPADAHAGHALGRVDFPVSCSPAAQAEFTRAVALLHHMTYPQARLAFERVASVDPACAMAHWGVAMTLFQPLWPTRPKPADLRRGFEEAQKAESLQPRSERERLFVATATAFFQDPAGSDYWLRVRRWEAAAKKVYDAFPDDPEAATFYALAHLATAPADTISREHQDRAAEILLRVYAKNPDHPGVMHYLVHANDAPGREREQLDVTHRYEQIAPRNPHALHMPTHIYTRLGDWDGVVRGNLKAAEAALETPAGEHGELVWDEFPHAIEYLVYAYLQQGADDRAAAQLARLRATPALEPSFKTAFHLASTQARYALERHAWADAAGIAAREPATLPWDRFPWPEAIARFAHGLGTAHVGRLADARADVARMDTLERAAAASGEDLFTRNVRMLRLGVAAWIAQAEGKPDSAIRAMQAAVDLEGTTPKHAVTPGPTIPALELLGDLLMEQRKPGDALTAYRASLEHYPNRLNSLVGVARAARASGDAAAARAAWERVIAVAGAGSRRAVLDEARAAVSRP